MTHFYNIIASERSRNSYGGHGEINLVIMSEEEIISIAQDSAGREGHSLEDYADIETVGIGEPDKDGDFERYDYARGWADGEELEAAIEYWTRDGFVYEIFESGKEDREFIARAADFGLEVEAIEFLKD